MDKATFLTILPIGICLFICIWIKSGFISSVIVLIGMVCFHFLMGKWANFCNKRWG